MFGQVTLLEQRNRKTSARGVSRDASAINAAADDDQVKNSSLEAV
jgi:hypothetical protein